MKTVFTNLRRSLLALLITLPVLLAGCGGKEVAGTTPTTSTGGGSTTTGQTSMALSLVNAAGSTVTSISSSSPAFARAVLTDTNGIAIPNTVVTFSTDATLATLTPSTGTALTDSSGIASISIAPATISAAGAATLTATASVSGATVTGSTGFTIGAATYSMSTITLGAGSTSAAPLSAFGTTSVSVTVSSNGTPITSPQIVNFTSSCAASGTAVLSTGITTVNGVATASYRDNGCAGSDVITASLSGTSVSQTVTIYVTPAAVGSIQFISATPQIISLSGTGGTSSSQVAFKVLDGGGNPLAGKIVTFNLSTTLGGITLTPSAPAQATSDANGLVFTNVNAGVVSTPVRVTATTPNSTNTGVLSTQSNQLTITTGIPAQSSFSLSASTLNIEGWDLDGTTTTITARLADHFNNPPPDGTAVNFTSEGARVVGSCTTVNGDCSVTFNSQALRPSDGRVTVLAYAVGEESFIDTNGNGVADKAPGGTFGAELVDALGISTDKPEAWVDYNENLVRDNTEPYIDFNSNGAYDAADGFYNGVLCDNIATSSAGTCSTTKTIHVRGGIVIVLSGSTPVVTSNIATLTTYSAGTLNLDPANGTYGCGGTQTIQVKIVDARGNLMPAGTTVNFTATGNGTVVGTGGSFPVENASTAIASIPAYNYSVTVKGDGSLSGGTCTDTTTAGTLSVTVTTPSGRSTKVILANLKN